MYRKISILFVFAFLVITIFSFPQSASASTEEPQAVRELNELRESNSKTFLLSNGNYEWVGYTEDVHYLDRNGAYQEISNKVIPEVMKTEGSDYAYRNEANKFIVRFAENTTEKYLVNIDYKGNSISFGPANGKNISSAVIGNIENEMLLDIACTNNCVTFKNIYSDTDLVYKIETYGIKEYIILNRFTEKNEYVFDLKMDGVSAKQDRENIIFTDANGNNVFNTGALYAVDSEGVQTKAVTCELIENSGEKQIKVTIDKAYLADANRSFPIIIDPAVIITGESKTFDSFVSYRYPNNNYYLYDWLRTGRDTDYYARRSFIKFTLPTNIPGYAVTSAYLRIKKYSGANPVMHAYKVIENWTSSTVTWNSQPEIDDEYESTLAYNDSGSWWRMYITTPVTDWLEDPNNNFGLMLRDATESGTTQWTTFYSSDADSPNKPELHIEYIAPCEITSVDPIHGYLTLDSYTHKVWVSGTVDSVTFEYPLFGEPTISTTLNYGSSYYSRAITPSSEDYVCGMYEDGSWESPGSNYGAMNSEYYDSWPTSIFICMGSRSDYSDIDSTFYYTSTTANSLKGVSTDGNFNSYNCLAYAVDVNNQWLWPWGWNPTESQLDDYMSKSYPYSTRPGSSYTRTTENNYPDVIYYSEYSWGSGEDGHFGIVSSWDANGYPKSIFSKWGAWELIYSSDSDPFISFYGGPKAYYKE